MLGRCGKLATRAGRAGWRRSPQLQQLGCRGGVLEGGRGISHSSVTDARLEPQKHRLVLGAQDDSSAEEEARLAVELEAQRKLVQASAQSMSVIYCREHGTSRFKRWLRGISIDSSFDFRRWRKHQQASRHLILWMPRNLLRADNIRRLLFPDLALVAASSSLLCYYNMFLATSEDLQITFKAGFNIILHPDMIALPLECFTLTSVALGLLATFKTQTCYNRFIEGRNLWGQLINESRALGSRILARVPGREKPTIDRGKKHAVKLIRTFPITLKYHLTEDGCNPHIEIGTDKPEAEVKAAVAMALRAELSQIWSLGAAEERAIVERIMSQEVANRPLQVLHEISYINGAVFAQPHLGNLDGPAATEVDRSLTTFHNVLGACEKILRTPVYTPYTRFTSRFLWLWCNALPLALYPLVGPVGTVPVSLLVSFFMLGIEDIGSRVEQPFDVMPLWQYCATVDQSCVQLEKLHQLMDKATPVEQPEEEEEEEDYDEFNYDADDPRLRSFADPL